MIPRTPYRHALHLVGFLCACGLLGGGAPVMAAQIDACQTRLPPLQSRLACAPN